MVLISFQDLCKIDIFLKFHRCGSKIEPATPFWNLNFKWAWQAQFLSHTYETLEKYLFYIDLSMILVPFFEIHDRVWDKNFVHRCHIHILSHLWANPSYIVSTVLCDVFRTKWVIRREWLLLKSEKFLLVWTQANIIVKNSFHFCSLPFLYFYPFCNFSKFSTFT